jgi:hypothetical protein
VKRALLFTFAAAALLTGCASSRSVLYSGVSSPLGTKKVVVTDAAAVREGRSERSSWLAMIRRAGPQSVGLRFPNLSAREFRLRLAAAAARYGFTVKRVQFVHGRRVAPLVVVQTRHYLELARAIPSIEHAVDPHKGRNDSTGWSFQGIFLEAVDERGVPFVIVDNVVSGSGVGGGQWARSDRLFPFVRI